jgi:hypothetical protein
LKREKDGDKMNKTYYYRCTGCGHKNPCTVTAIGDYDNKPNSCVYQPASQGFLMWKRIEKKETKEGVAFDKAEGDEART